MPEPYLSVVVPAYNEAGRIGQSLTSILSFLHRQKYSSEIIVVDDGSSDATVAVSKEKLHGFPHEILQNPGNKGKGYSVRQGVLRARGKFILFSDADLSTPIEEVEGFLQHLENSYDIVIGSRALPDSKVEIHQNALRERMGKTFNLFARFLTFRDIHDSQCGFKCFKHDAAQDLFSRQKMDGFSFDVEIIYLAQKKGYRILEAPVTWRNSPKSRVRILADPFHMFFDLAKIRRLHG